MKTLTWLVAAQSLVLSAATIPFEGVVAGTIFIHSPGPVIENSATGSATLAPFGTGDYFKRGVLDFATLNPDGSSAGSGTFSFTFEGGDSFFGDYIETAFPPAPDGAVVFSHVYTITGGTGMFEGATGAASHPPVTTTLDDLEFTFSLSGNISAPLLTPIPEPSTNLTGIAVIGLLVLRKRLLPAARLARLNTSWGNHKEKEVVV